jgi:uncharacterized NAD(P)/FAD-binding protein YdhS
MTGQDRARRIHHRRGTALPWCDRGAERGAAEDPKIRLTQDGWQLSEGDDSAQASVMIEAVLPAPDLSRIDDPLLAGLMRDGRVVACGKGLGARICADGLLMARDGQPQPGLAMLGRMALGSVIAADSIHDCFGAAADRWAEDVLKRARQAPRGRLRSGARAVAPPDRPVHP